MNTGMTSNQHGAVVVIDLDEVAMATVGVTLPPLLRQWARSPDVYALVLQRTRAAAPGAANAMTMEQTADLLNLIWRLDSFPKPLIALLDAPLTPLDIGLSTLGTHRVGGEGYRLAIPPSSDRDGLPAAGIAYALARLPESAGENLIESGRAIGPREAYAAGLLTHAIPATEFPSIIAALADGQPVDQVLDGLQRALAETQVAGEPARAARETPRSASTEIVLRLVSDARILDVRDSLIATYRAAAALHSQPNFANGTFAPQRQPISADLLLPLRSDLESGRF